MAILQDDTWLSTMFHGGGGNVDDPHSLPSPIVSCFLDLQQMNKVVENKLRNDFHSILTSMERLSLSPSTNPSSPPNPPMRATSSHNSPFTIAAYSWLLENIANPYPSSTVKTSLAQQFNCSLSAINSWFVNARRRIGWTAVCRDHFKNCRADALDAAHRAFVDEDPKRPLAPDAIHAFFRVKVAAEELYSSTFKSALADDLDAVVKDVTAEDAIPVHGPKHDELQEVESSDASEMQSQNKKQCYWPSSDYSDSSSSPVPALVESLTDESEEDADVAPPILAGRKRRSSCTEPAYSAAFPAKRRRNLCASSSVTEACPLSFENTRSSCNVLISQPPTSISASHGRLTSGTDTTGMEKHPHSVIGGPRFYAVPDPLPLTTPESDDTIDDWLKSNFVDLFLLPPPADVVTPDALAQWEVELFNNYNTPQESQQPFQPLNHSTQDPPTLVDTYAFDDFFQSFQSGEFTPPDITDSTFPTSTADTVLQDLSSLEPIDWTALLNGQPGDPIFDPIFDQWHTNSLPLPEIDLSILQLP